MRLPTKQDVDGALRQNGRSVWEHAVWWAADMSLDNQLRQSLMNRLRVLALLLCILSSSTSLAQEVGILHLRPLHLELPTTWTFDGSKQPIEGKGPDGEKVLISILRRRLGAASGPVATANEMAKEFAQGLMRELASKGGKAVVRPVSEFPAQDGKAAYSAGSELSSTFAGKSYFVQYLLAAPDVIIYFTFEGKGEALPAMQRFDPFFATQRWEE